MDPKEELWRRAEPKLFISREEFLRNLDGWEIVPIQVEGVVGLIVCRKGPEFHFQSMDTGKPFGFATIREVVQPIIDAHGYALTKTPKEEVRQHRFNRLIGFVQVGEDEYDVHYRIDKIRGGKEGKH